MQECDDEYDDEYDEYYDEYEYELHRNCVQKKYNRLVIYNSTREDDFNDFKKVYNLIIDNLKENRWYNYNKMYSGKLKITANENTQKMINFE